VEVQNEQIVPRHLPADGGHVPSLDRSFAPPAAGSGNDEGLFGCKFRLSSKHGAGLARQILVSLLFDEILSFIKWNNRDSDPECVGTWRFK